MKYPTVLNERAMIADEMDDVDWVHCVNWDWCAHPAHDDRPKQDD